MVVNSAKIEAVINNFIDKHSLELETKTYQYGDFVRNQGDKSGTIYIVKEGIFRISRIDKEGFRRF